MSAIKMQAAVLNAYKGNSGLFYEEDLYVVDITRRDTVFRAEHSMFYEVVRILSAIVVLGFVTLLGLSITTGGPVHWAVSVIGCLGSVGLAGAVWLSKPYLRRHGYS